MTPILALPVLRTQSDERLLELARAGHERAYEALVQRYRKPLLAYCRRLLLPESRAEDVVQQVFLSAWTSLNTDTDIRHVRAWLYRITHNTALNALKRSGYDYAELHEALHGADAPEEDLARRITIRETLAAMANLPELQREALIRTAVKGHTHEQVARDLGLTGTVVRGLVYRARATVRAAASALMPPPLVMWAATRVQGSPLTQRVSEIVAGGGGAAGLATVLIKGGAVVAAAGALATGAATLPAIGHASRPDRPSQQAEVRNVFSNGQSAGPGSGSGDLASLFSVVRPQGGRALSGGSGQSPASGDRVQPGSRGSRHHPDMPLIDGRRSDPPSRLDTSDGSGSADTHGHGGDNATPRPASGEQPSTGALSGSRGGGDGGSGSPGSSGGGRPSDGASGASDGGGSSPSATSSPDGRGGDASAGGSSSPETSGGGGGPSAYSAPTSLAPPPAGLGPSPTSGGGPGPSASGGSGKDFHPSGRSASSSSPELP